MPRSDSRRADELVAAALLESARSSVRPVVLIDGGSGSGKSTIAEALASALGAQRVSLEDIYPGWHGLEQASDAVRATVLAPDAPGWLRWDWARGERAEWHPLDPEKPLVVEGSGGLSAANRALATLGIWVELDPETRKARALERDGDLYAPWWDIWAEQERAFAQRERPREHADLILDGHDISTLAAALGRPLS
ncbi:AAA family ATPase [soil metagenome]